jgi:hypothetical protein
MCETAVEESGLGGHGVRALDGERRRACPRNHREVGTVKLRVDRSQLTGQLVQRRPTAGWLLL